MDTEPDIANPAQFINWLYEQRTNWSDDKILAELRALPVLPDEDTLMTIVDRQDWHNVYLFLALADQAAKRRLHPALELLLERASFGDPGETMRGLRHSLEEIVNPDWHILTEVCMEVTSYPQRGARLWAVNELGVLRDERARAILVDTLNDPEEEVGKAAWNALRRLNEAQT